MRSAAQLVVTGVRLCTVAITGCSLMLADMRLVLEGWSRRAMWAFRSELLPRQYHAPSSWQTDDTGMRARDLHGLALVCRHGAYSIAPTMQAVLVLCSTVCPLAGLRCPLCKDYPVQCVRHVAPKRAFFRFEALCLTSAVAGDERHHAGMHSRGHITSLGASARERRHASRDG